jgi:glycosyltransferase involved in cell wall biosynthesis
MRVAVVFYGLTPHGGGAFTFQRSLADRLTEVQPQSSHEFLFYSAGVPSADPNVIDIPGSRVAAMRRRAIDVVREVQDRFSMPRYKWRTWFERSLDERDIDFVWFAANYAEDCDRPYLFTVFDLAHLVQPYFPEVSRNGEWQQRHHHFGRHIPRAAAVIVPNQAGKQQVLRYFPVEDERILCLGHPTPEFAAQAPPGTGDAAVRQRLGVAGRYLFYPAQFWAHKNHYNALRALAALRAAGGDYRLVLVGSDKGQAGHVSELAREHGVADAVLQLGFVEIDELVALYRGAHALLYLSFFGTENLPPLEAFALGCPVVASDIPGAREQLGDAALLVPLTDPDAIAEAVRRFENEETRRRHIAAGRDRAAELTSERYVRGVLEFLDEFEHIRWCWT